MTTILIFAALAIGAAFGLVLGGMLSAGKADDAYLRGRMLERADAGDPPFGGTD